MKQFWRRLRGRHHPSTSSPVATEAESDPSDTSTPTSPSSITISTVSTTISTVSTAEARDPPPAYMAPWKYESRETTETRLRAQLDYGTNDELEKADLLGSLLHILGNSDDAAFCDDRILTLCWTFCSCLLKEYLTFKYDHPPRYDYAHITDVQRQLSLQLVDMTNAFDCPNDVTLAGAAVAERLRLKTDVLVLAVHTIGRVRMAVWRDLLEVMPATTALAYSLLATVDRVAEYIFACFALGENPSPEKSIRQIRAPLSRPRTGTECSPWDDTGREETVEDWIFPIT